MRSGRESIMNPPGSLDAQRTTTTSALHNPNAGDMGASNPVRSPVPHYEPFRNPLIPQSISDLLKWKLPHCVAI